MMNNNEDFLKDLEDSEDGEEQAGDEKEASPEEANRT